MRYSEILCESTPKTLYHGTLKEFLPSILSMGATPTVGDFTRNAYSEYREAGIELPNLLFAADKSGLGKCISAIMGALESKGIRLTPESFFNNAAIIVFKQGEEDFDYRSEKEFDHHYATVEPEDYYREYGLIPDYVLTGNKLKTFLRNNRINLAYRFSNLDQGGERNRAIKDIIKLEPSVDKKSLLAMSTDDLKQYLVKLKYKN